MGSRYLTWLADELRAAGITVIEHAGWQTRARSSGGYEAGRPWLVMWHHTASDADPADDAAYCATGSPDAPICNVIVNRDGSVTVIAAGATNTNGKGGPINVSKGTVPADQMNTHAFGMEIANDGVGGTYSEEQIDAAFTVSDVVNRLCGNEPTDVCTHAVYAPERKIDPARAGAVAGGWRPGGYSSADTWVLEDVEAEAELRAGQQPAPPDPTPTGRLLDMYLLGVIGPNSEAPTVIRVDASTVTWEANANAQGIDQWFGVPYKQAGDADASALLVSRKATNALAVECFDPASPYYCPQLAAAWRQ